MKLIDPIIKSLKKYKNNSFFKAKFYFTKYYEKTTIKENYILIQSFNGSNIVGNPYYILLELCNNDCYSHFKKAVVSNKDSYLKIQKIVKEKKLKNVEVIQLHSKKYCKLLAESKYLINNEVFSTYFIKKEGQVYLNTWKQAAPKFTGRNAKEFSHELGNYQRNFLMANYLLYPNNYLLEKNKDLYMLDNLYKGKYVIYKDFDNLRSSHSYKKNIANKLNYTKRYIYQAVDNSNIRDKNNELINETKNLCELIFLNKTNSHIKVINAQKSENSKKNILIYSGALQKNGITAALKGLLNNINLEENNYYLTFFRKHAANNDKQFLMNIPKKLNYIPIQGTNSLTISEAIAQYLFFRLNIDTKYVKKKLKSMYKREIERIYPKIKFDYVIDFCGYDKQIIILFGYMNAKKIRFTHSVMQDEKKMKNNLHLNSIRFAYESYDDIVGIREGMDKEIETLFSDIKPKHISLVHNVNDIVTITNNATKNIEFQEKTYSNLTIKEINQILNNKDITKFINIARFSKEKGLDRLILAFEDYRKKNPNAYLFLIGGNGAEFKNLLNLVKEREIKNIIIIKNIMNPYPILKKADLFILSSYYEGLPMTIMEALILGVPVLSTNIKGPRNFLEQGYAHLVENSQNGLLEGMNDFTNNKFKNLKKFDAEEFNKKAIKEFYDLLK